MVLFIMASFCLCLYPVAPLHAQGDQTVKNGDLTQAINFPAANCTYNWTNDNTTIGLQAKSSGNIASFKAINNGVAPAIANITATIFATPAYGYRTNADKNPRTISRVDLTTYQDAGNLPIPNAQILQMSPDGQILYVKDPAKPNSIYLVSTVTNQIADEIPVSKPYYNLMLSPDGGKIYLQNSVFSGANYDKLFVIDVASKTEEAPILVDQGLFASNMQVDPRYYFSKDGTKIYMINDWGTTIKTGTFAIFDRATKQMLTKKTDMKRPTDLIESNDGSKLYIASATANMPVQIYDIQTGNVQEIPLTGAVYRMVLSADGNYLYAQGYNFLDKIDLRDNSVTPFDAGFSSLSIVTMIPNRDRTRIFYQETATGNVILIDANDGTMTGNRIRIDASSLGNPNIDVSSSDIQLSPDGTQLFITSRIEDFANGNNRAYITVVDVRSQQTLKKIPLPSMNAPGIRLYQISKYCTASTIKVKITVNPDPATITPSTTPLAKHNTIYGAPSTAATFSVSGKRINNGILVTPPAGFELSLNGTAFTNTLTVPGTGDINTTTVYIRLSATTGVGKTYGGNIALTNGTTTANLNMPMSEVTPTTLTLAAKDATKTYGTKLTDATGWTDFIPTGLKNGETIGSVSIKYGPGALATDGVKPYSGSVTISNPTGGTFSPANYTLGPSTPANIIVTQATLTVTADDKQRYFAEDNPTFTFKYSGFIIGEDEAQLTTKPTASTTATITSPLGNYPINITGGSATNYKIEAKAGTLTIISRMITPVTAFTPNGDGINDTWAIPNITQYPNCTVEVFSRTGSKVFRAIGYAKPWDGRYNQTDLPAGTYYYVINLGNGTKTLSGSLAVIR